MSKSDGPCQLIKSKNLSLIELKNSVKITQAADFKILLIEAIKENKSIRIDMSALNDLDVTTIQLLFAAKNKALANQIDFNMFPISESVKETFRFSGVLHEIFSSTNAQ